MYVEVIKQNDTLRFEAQLDNPRTGEAFDLSTADSVRLYVYHPLSETLVVNDLVEVVDATAGEIAYDFAPAQTARYGSHRAEVVARFDDGATVISVPADGHLELNFTETLPRDLAAETVEADADLTVASLEASVEIMSHGRIRGLGMLHKRVLDADDDLEIPAGYGMVAAGPLEGDGSISGDGTLKVI